MRHPNSPTSSCWCTRASQLASVIKLGSFFPADPASRLHKRPPYVADVRTLGTRPAPPFFATAPFAAPCGRVHSCSGASCSMCCAVFPRRGAAAASLPLVRQRQAQPAEATNRVDGKE